MFELVSAPAENPARSAAVGGDGELEVVWSADGHRSTLPPGLAARPPLRRRRASGRPTTSDRVGRRHTAACRRRSTGRRCSPTTTPCSSGSSRLRAFGVSRLRDVPARPRRRRGRWPARVGIVRETNFGVLWDVRSEPDPITNANTPLSLPPHVDLATREYQPGLQFLHCIENSAPGGQGVYLDGFRVAEILRDEHPDDFAVLDHRAVAVGQPVEGQRLPLGVDADRPRRVTARSPRCASATGCGPRSTPPFDAVEAAYAAYRTLFEVTLPRRPHGAASRSRRATCWPSTTGASCTAATPTPPRPASACSAAATASATSCSSRIRILRRAQRAACPR